MVIDPNCQVCRHKQRLQIDLSVGVQGQRATAKQFGVSRQAIQRHLDKGHCDGSIKPPPGAKLEPIVVVPIEIPDKPPLVDQTLAYDGVMDTPPDDVQGVSASDNGAPQRVPPKPHKKRKRKGKMPPRRPVVDRRTVSDHERMLATVSDYTTRKRYVGKLLRTGTFNGMPTLDRLKGCWPDLSMIQLAEIVAQAAMEADFLRGTRQARRLVALAKIDKVFRKAFDKEDLKTALRAIELGMRADGISAEPDLIASLAASQAWAIAARVLQAKFPEAFEAIHGELIAEEARKRQALAPATMETDHAAE